MVQPANLGESHDITSLATLHFPAVRRILVEAEMTPGFVVVADVLLSKRSK